MIRAVLFDLDGTLVNTNKLVLASFKYTLEKHSSSYPGDDEMVKHFGEPLITTMEGFDSKNAQKLFNTYREYNEKIHDDMVEKIDGAEETVRKLKAMGVKVGVVSSKRRPMVDRGLRVTGLEGLMDVIITPEDTKKHKPEGEPVLKACELLDVDAENSLMVGDSHFDILCGKNAGAKTCAVKYTALPFDSLLKYKPDCVIENMIDLIDIVNNENSKENKVG